MAINKATRYAGRWEAATDDYPMGKPKNKTSEIAKDGSYFEKDWLSDYEAFFGAAMNGAGQTPNGTVDTAESSQIFDAMLRTVVDAVRYVGSTMKTFDGNSPQLQYTWQTWVLIEGDASIRLGDGSDQSTTPAGNNTPSVPVVAHNHSAGTRTKSEDTGVFLYGNKTASYNGTFMSVGSSGSTSTREGYTSTTGVTSPTMDVRGKSIKMNLWLRTA